MPIFEPLMPLVDGFRVAWETASTAITTAAQAIFTGVYEWLVTRFQEVVDGIRGKIDAVTGFFRDMHQTLVGGSIVPDMVAGIGASIATLDQLMVDKAGSATAQVAGFFRGMLTRVQDIMVLVGQAVKTTGEEMVQNVAGATSGMIGLLRSFGVKSKALAIAGALIDTYTAVSKALASAPWPYNLIPAAAALGAGLANVAKIRQTDVGYAQGTPNLDFVDFGRESARMLHNEEAVVPRGGGHMLAAEIAAAMPQRDETQLMLLNEKLDALPRLIGLEYLRAMRLAT
jgi:hypothetical protein